MTMPHDKNEDPNGQELVLDTIENAQALMERFTAQEATEYVRSFVQLINSQSPETKREYEQGENPIACAQRALIGAALFQECFALAYDHTNQHVKDIDALHRAFKL